MDKYFAKKDELQNPSSSKKPRLEFKVEDLISDPGLRPPISSYDINDQDIIRRSYLQKGPCQPRGHDFQFTQFGNKPRRFVSSWFDEYRNWLEYSVSKNAAFCLCCYVFPQFGCDPAFVSRGFTNWKDKKGLGRHVGNHNSPHNISRKMCEDLMNQKQNIEVAFSKPKQSDASRMEYRTRLCASIDCVRFLLRQGLSFRGHDESDESLNRGNFLELLEFLASHNETIEKVVLENAPQNNKLTSPKIQKDIVSAIARETTQKIITDIGDNLFTILVDESRDISIKEQMAIVVRFVSHRGEIIERLLGIVHVTDTTAISLKGAIDCLFSKHGLSITRLRGQGYDGASNMQDEFNGLKTLIIRENSCAFYIHCFAHQLQLILVSVAEGHADIAELFEIVTNVMNVVGGSCKRRDILRAKEVDRVAKELGCKELESGQGLNQERGIKRAGDTRWGSHYGSLLNLTHMFPSVIDVLQIVKDDGKDAKQRGQASMLYKHIQSFEFIFLLLLMKNILGKTNELSQALQRKDQDIVNAMCLVKLSKELLSKLRNDDNEWKSFVEEVFCMCGKLNIEVSNMDDMFVTPGRSRRKLQEITNLHHYRFEIFNTVIDRVLNELNDRFNEANTELLLCVTCLDPSNGFASFDKKKLIRLAELYPSDFSPVDCMVLDSQLDTYILDMRSSHEFSQLNGISGLATKLVELRKDLVYPSVYLLLKLALLLPVATATVERVFSAMKIIKNRLRNKMGDEWMNDSLVTYIERDVVATIDNNSIMTRFQDMCTRREVL